MSFTPKDLEDLAKAKAALLKEFFQAEPPQTKGEDLVELWRQIYDEQVQSAVIESVETGPSEESNSVLPYEKLQARACGDGVLWVFRNHKPFINCNTLAIFKYLFWILGESRCW